jgi:hypothetical protein
LEFQHEPVRDFDIGIILNKPFFHLTYLSIEITFLPYHEFEIFMKKISSKLKIFHLTVRNNHPIYLASHLWERFILQYMPRLEKFYLKFFEDVDDEEREGDYIWPDDQFTSAFWLERKWIFTAEINTYEIIYSIYPYKYLPWYKSTKNDLNSMATLTIEAIRSDESLKLLLTNINWISTVTTIYHLKIYQRPISIRTLVDIINILPILDSVKIYSLSLSKSKRLSSKERKFLTDIKKNNRVTKVYLEKMTKFQEIISLMNLFPRLKYLQLDWTNYIDIELFLRIMKKSNHSLRSLCFCIPMADDEMIKKIQKIIDLEKLIHDYKIKRVCDQIYLQWE